MEQYNYYDSVLDDVREYIEQEIDLSEYSSAEELEEYLNEELFINDSITGNASGSYTYNAWKAEEYLCHNLELLQEACEAFGDDVGECIKKGAESCDVTIRCYLLGQTIHQAIKELDYDFDSDWDEE